MGNSHGIARHPRLQPLAMLTRLATLLTDYPRMTALVAGLVSATGFAPLGLWPLTLIAMAVLLHLIGQATTNRRTFLLGWLFGVGHFGLSLNWIATAFTFQAAMPAWLGWLAVILLALYLALYPALATMGARWLARRLMHPDPLARTDGNPAGDGGVPSRLHLRSLILTLTFAATWIVTEWLRSWLFTGFAWNPLSAAFPSHSIAPPLLRIVGSYGASGLVAILAGLIGIMVQAATQAPADWRRALWPTFALLAWCLLLVSGWLGQTAALPHKRIPVTVVQPNIGQGDKWDATNRAANFAKLANLSRRLPSQTEPRLLLWPEAAVPDYLEEGYPLDWYVDSPAAVRARLARLLGPGDLLLTGAVKLEPNADRSDIIGARNALFTLTSGAQLGPRYDKAHLVPYGEYLPMRPILSAIGLSRLAPGSVDFLAGPGARTLNLGQFGGAGIQICYEIIFAGQVVDRADRPDFIFNPSNDAWFGAWGPPQHLAQARLRAIEEGLPVIRSTPTGISAIIDGDGRVMQRIAMAHAGRIDAIIPAAHAPTLFARYGNSLALGLAALLLLIAVAISRVRRYRRT